MLLPSKAENFGKFLIEIFFLKKTTFFDSASNTKHFVKKTAFLLIQPRKGPKKGSKNQKRQGLPYRFWLKSGPNQHFWIYWAGNDPKMNKKMTQIFGSKKFLVLEKFSLVSEKKIPIAERKKISLSKKIQINNFSNLYKIIQIKSNVN